MKVRALGWVSNISSFIFFWSFCLVDCHKWSVYQLFDICYLTNVFHRRLRYCERKTVQNRSIDRIYVCLSNTSDDLSGICNVSTLSLELQICKANGALTCLRLAPPLSFFLSFFRRPRISIYSVSLRKLIQLSPKWWNNNFIEEKKERRIKLLWSATFSPRCQPSFSISLFSNFEWHGKCQ